MRTTTCLWSSECSSYVPKVLCTFSYLYYADAVMQVRSLFALARGEGCDVTRDGSDNVSSRQHLQRTGTDRQRPGRLTPKTNKTV